MNKGTLVCVRAVKVCNRRWFRGGKDPIRRSYQAFKDGIYYGLSALSPSNIKHKISEMQQMTIPELFIGKL